MDVKTKIVYEGPFGREELIEVTPAKKLLRVAADLIDGSASVLTYALPVKATVGGKQ